MKGDMTSEEAIEKLDALTTVDPERSHCEADDILLAVLEANGLGDVSKAWQAAAERTGFWYA
jgi:hypothetical protein